MILKVGFDVVREPGKNPRDFSYRDIKHEQDGWADIKKYLPIDFDLVLLKRLSKEPTPGWSTGTGWDGLRLDPRDKVIGWKQMPEESKAALHE